MNTSTLFVFNLLASLLYLVTHYFFSGITTNILLILVIILFLYTSEKIKAFSKQNPFSKSRVIILISCILLIVTAFLQPTNDFLYKTLLIIVVLSTESYELFLKG